MPEGIPASAAIDRRHLRIEAARQDLLIQGLVQRFADDVPLAQRAQQAIDAARGSV